MPEPEVGDVTPTDSSHLTEDDIRSIIRDELARNAGSSDDAEPDDTDDKDSDDGNRYRSGSRGKSYDDTSPAVKYITDPIRFINRTRLAWVSMFSMIAFAIILIFKVPPQNIENYNFIIGWCMSTFAAVILTYMGVTAWSQTSFAKVMHQDNIEKKKKKGE